MTDEKHNFLIVGPVMFAPNHISVQETKAANVKQHAQLSDKTRLQHMANGKKSNFSKNTHRIIL